jgi:transcription elongation factor Elf1
MYKNIEDRKKHDRERNQRQGRINLLNAARKIRRKAAKELIDEIKKTLGCIVCGENRPACLDFHHRDPKEKHKKISLMLDYTKKRILEEVKKCDVLCKNCHAINHWENQDVGWITKWAKVNYGSGF